MSITRKRAGRKAYETNRNFQNNVVDFFTALGKKEWKYSTETTSQMIIERTANGGVTERITFGKAYSEISQWFDLRKVFSNITENGFCDCLAEMFFQGSTIFTPKAAYRLFVEPETEMICLTDRNKEFAEAVLRGEKNNLEVFNDWDTDSFVVVNHDNDKHYRVNLKTINNRLYSDCECGDFCFRKRVCKHISAVLTETLFGMLAKN